MRAAHEIARAALAEVLRRAPLSAEKVDLTWKMSVGPPMAEATTAEALEGGVLRIRARDEAWQREVERSASLIRRRVEDLLGAGTVREIRVRT